MVAYRFVLRSISLSFAVGVLSFGTDAFLFVAQDATPAKSPAPAHLTSEQDHQRLMDLLGIKELRRGPDGNPKSPNAANIDESKVAPYALPDPLKFNSGAPVKTPKDWWEKRRPELVEIFDREIYGRVPARTPAVHWEVKETKSED